MTIEVVNEQNVTALVAQLHRLMTLRDRLSTYERLVISETMRAVADQIAPHPSRRTMLITPKGPRGRPLYWQQ